MASIHPSTKTLVKPYPLSSSSPHLFFTKFTKLRLNNTNLYRHGNNKLKIRASEPSNSPVSSSSQQQQDAESLQLFEVDQFMHLSN
ncbi:hypothetical protein Hanom_Chr06g00564771 [Helianthus anomalus]